MKNLYTLFAFLLLSMGLQGQCETIYLNSQEAIDNFETDYADCINMDGDGLIQIAAHINISGADVTNLNGLSNLRLIGTEDLYYNGSLDITSCSNLSSLAGLNNLETIDGNLSISHCDALINLEGLDNLTQIIGSLQVYDNANLASFQGLGGLNDLQVVDNGILISANPVLTNLDVFFNVDYLSDIEILNNTSLVSLAGLSNISELGLLRIEGNEALTSLEGLQGLIVAWSISIIGNTSLTNIDALSGIHSDVMDYSWQNEIVIEDNPALISLQGLANIEMLNSGMNIINNDALENLDGVNLVSGTMTVGLNDALQNIDALETLTTSPSISIFQNAILSNLNGLSNLENLGYINIGSNPALTSLDGISGFNESTFFDIVGNEALTDISVLQNLPQNYSANILINFNNSLENCCVVLPIEPEFIFIGENAPGCSSQEDVLEYCTAYSFQVFAFYDENENGILDEGEQGVFNQNISINPEALVTFTNDDGLANIYLENDGIHEVSIETSALWEVNNGISSVEVNVVDGGTVYFPLSPVIEFGNPKLDLTSSITRCFQTTNYWLTYTNDGTLTSSGTLFLVPDETTTLVSADPAPDSIANGTLFWSYEDLAPSHSSQINLEFEMPGVDALGQQISFYAQMDADDDLGGDKTGVSSELICAYDPNDKLVTPIGVGEQSYTLFGDTLAYTIRFQNTGNDTAFSIVVRDTLSEFVNLNSFRPISSSHTVETLLDTETRIVEFVFNDIYLADSFVNEPGSHGFIKFEIETIDNIDENTLVENTAGIYFDFNPPIVTNTVNNTFVSVIPIAGFEFQCKVFLEGCYENGGYMTADLLSLIPSNQPYSIGPWYYLGDENLSEIPSTMIDWVLVEARIGAPSLTGEVGTFVIETQAGILLEDGSIVGSDGGALRFINLEEGADYYFSIRHRNHLSVLTAIPLTANSLMQYDFTTNANQAYGAEQQKGTSDGNAVMYSGDINADGIIQITDFDIWFQNKALLNSYHPADLNLDNVVQTTDFDVWFWNKAKVGIVEFQE